MVTSEGMDQHANPAPNAGRDRTPAPRVSVGLPVYNGERYLEAAIESALGQTYEDFELIISDNASEDRTEAICRHYADLDERIRYRRHPRNLGAARNYNSVFAASRGELFRWVAHDDLSAPELLERCIGALDRAGARAVLAFPRTRIVDERGDLVEDWAHQGPSGGRVPHERLRDLLGDPRGHLHLCSPVFGIIRSDALRRTRLYQSFNSADKVLLVELALLGDFVEVPELLFMRRFHEGTSLRANRTPEAVAAWFDPSRRGPVMPRTRLFRGYASAVARTSMSPAERLRCLGVLGQATVRDRNWRVIGGELKDVAARRLARALSVPRPDVAPPGGPAPLDPTAPVRISAVIPTYNRAELVIRAIQSALAQTRPPDEVVVVDDGSTDDTSARVAGFGHRVRYVRQSNAGGAVARNRGVEAATGEWVAFLDSDDVWTPHHLERMEQAIRATSGSALFYFGDTERTSTEAGASLWELAGFRVVGPHELRPDATEWVMRPRQPTMLQSTVFNRRAYLDCGGLAERLTRRHDTHLFLRLGLGGAACAVAAAGSRMTADDTGGRLTDVWDGESGIYWRCTVSLCEDALRQARGRETRSALHARLGFAHWRLARLDWRDGRRRAALGSVVRCALASPAGLGRILLRSVARMR